MLWHRYSRRRTILSSKLVMNHMLQRVGITKSSITFSHNNISLYTYYIFYGMFVLKCIITVFSYKFVFFIEHCSGNERHKLGW